MALRRGRRALGGALRWLPAALVLLAAFALTGCGGPAHPRAATVVASTGVWGSVALAITGRHVPVNAILTESDTDPHSYAASPSDAAAITDAALVVYNGGGYDPWVEQVLAGHAGVQSIGAYSFLKQATAGGQPANEHVFYNLDVAKSVAFAIADRVAAIDPAHAADYRANAAEFCRGADAIAISEHAIASAYPGTAVIATEPVGHYLLAASGLVNRTPPAFTAANENETDPSPADMAFVLDLINHRQVAAVLINPQTSTAAINGLRDAARRSGVPVTEVSETLPAGTDYLTWQRNTVNQLLTALQSGRSVQP
ncbi:ABC transporter substrate-binding protein [Mycobacterium sp. E342]|uniref:metal ABC transporter solute-binding protein, Zn/Mn family n=1 Tax=Mycobacterium sp. E342 TaxID=1834147 RepID=UPI0007FF5B98|nr:zinc ABC transporter substrate-binding protein [Mycobacterium sp. E342]OBH39373.1 ABC transporter substrate-binding protein [Mycobacterium sp. E342]